MRVYNRLGLVSGCRGPPQAGDQQGDFIDWVRRSQVGDTLPRQMGPHMIGRSWCVEITQRPGLQWSFFFFLTCESESGVAQLCPTLCDPMDCSLPGSSVHGIFQAIVLEWIAISFSRGSSRPRDQTQVSHIVDRRFTIWATACIYY